MSDFRGKFFSLNKTAPEILPDRIRLHDNTTRYAYSITIEELNSIGYEGPIFVPTLHTDQHLVWHPETLSYTVEEGPDPQHGRYVCPAENSEAVALLNSRIQNSTSSFDESGEFTDEYKKEYGVYKGKLLDLYFKQDQCCLTVDQIPSPPLVPRSLAVVDYQYRSQLASGLIENYKQLYESFGVIPDIHPDLVDWLPLPGSDWVQGSGLLDVEVLVCGPSGCLLTKPSFGRHCFS